MIESSHTRRTVLQIAAAAAASAGGVGTVAAQEDDDEGADDDTDRLPIVLGARSEYWYGVAPEAIEGEENPTLEFADGEAYELVWINLDGAEHDLVLESEDGEEFAVSDATETAGEAVSMTVEASDEIDEYYCGFHPDSMRGDVELNGGFDRSRRRDRDEDRRGPQHDNGDHHHDENDRPGLATAGVSTRGPD
ncbi:cupredoxin domain-containing protein [Natronococcus roseus]|uniref:cupredoxin domain-containing protein n=1 Tax=Natronococcus roseus TaxID=1052014 RepID=UPI00374D9F4A